MLLAARQLLRAVRGQHSQLAFARRLGYRGNPIPDWESGRRSPTATEALRACDKIGIDVRAAFLRFHRVPLLKHGECYDIATWLTALRGTTSISHLAATCGASRHQISRWLKGQATPRLFEFLTLVEAITGRVCDLVAELVPIGQVPELLVEYERRLAARRLAHDEPWTEAILRLLETVAYRNQKAHVPGRIARALDISLETESRCLDKLLEAGIIGYVDGLYRNVRSLTVDTQAVPKLKQHWCQIAMQRLREPAENDVFCYNVLAASQTDVDRIHELLLATFREIRAIVGHTSADEVGALVNIQLINWTFPE